MTAVGAGSTTVPSVSTRGATTARVLTAVATIVVIVAVALVPLLTPWFMHPALDSARSAAWLGATNAQAQALSDETVAELALGPGTFAFAGPDGKAFFDAAERGHMQDARTLLLLLFAAAAASAAGIAVALKRRDGATTLRAISTGGGITVIGVLVIGGIGVVAFEPLFELFHRVFFPGGNWAFDPRTEHLVQLYPYAFWEIAAAALGVLVLLFGSVTWWLARRLAGRRT